MNAGQKADAAAVLERALHRAIARAEAAEQQLEDAIDYRDAVAQDHLEEKARAEAAERERDHAWNCHKGQVETKRRLSRKYGQLHAALIEAEAWIQEVDHVEDCAAFDRTSSRECDCGRTAILKRVRTTTEGERDG